MSIAVRTRHLSALATTRDTPATPGQDSPSAPAAPLPPRLLRPRAVCERTGLSRTTLWRLERRGDFPPHRQISTNAIGWLEEDVTTWIRTRTQR